MSKERTIMDQHFKTCHICKPKVKFHIPHNKGNLHQQDQIYQRNILLTAISAKVELNIRGKNQRGPSMMLPSQQSRKTEGILLSGIADCSRTTFPSHSWQLRIQLRWVFPEKWSTMRMGRGRHRRRLLLCGGRSSRYTACRETRLSWTMRWGRLWRSCRTGRCQ